MTMLVELTRLEGKWSYEELNAFLANPKGFAPGTRMGGVQGVADAADRASLILFLRENGDDPPPLPGIEAAATLIMLQAVALGTEPEARPASSGFQS